jgi:hypothetical protein
MRESDPLSRLVGGDLDTVSFVRDYVEFRIDYNVLRALTDPVVEMPDGAIHRFPHPGSRDALCSLIDTTVTAAVEIGPRDRSDCRLELKTSAGHTFVIPLDSASMVGPEAAHLIRADERGRPMGAEMVVW